MQKVIFQVPELDGMRKFFVRIEDDEPVEGCHGFTGPWHWKNEKSVDGYTHDLEIDVREDGVLEMEAYAYVMNPRNRLQVMNDISHPLTVILVDYQKNL